jgi:hypothetical protein
MPSFAPTQDHPRARAIRVIEFPEFLKRIVALDKQQSQHPDLTGLSSSASSEHTGSDSLAYLWEVDPTCKGCCVGTLDLEEMNC